MVLILLIDTKLGQIKNKPICQKKLNSAKIKI